MDGLPPHEAPVAPLTVACVVQAADYHGVPLAALAGILRQEDGRVGRVSPPNRNGTRDHGPMQINSIHLPALAKQGITASMVTNDGCVNVYVGAWLLARSIEDASGRLWDGIGRYHSRTPKLKKRYIRNVWKRIEGGIDIRRLVDRVNSALAPRLAGRKSTRGGRTDG